MGDERSELLPDNVSDSSHSAWYGRGGKFYIWPVNMPRKTTRFTMLKMMLKSSFTFTVGYFLMCFYIDTVMQAVVQRRADRKNPTYRSMILPDIGFDLFPHWTSVHYADYCLVVIVILTALRFLATNYMRWTIIRRWLLVLATLFLLRSFTIISTMLPNPEKDCKNTTVEGNNVFYTGLMVLLLRQQTCADVLYSGHTVNLTLCALVWHTYSHVTPITDIDPLSSCVRMPLTSSNGWDLNRMTLPKWAIWSIAVLGYIMILVTRFHYTADVWIGGLLTCFIWKWYHHYIRTAHERHNSFNQLICWMERNADDLHPGDSSPLPTIYKVSYTASAANFRRFRSDSQVEVEVDESDSGKEKIIVIVRADINLSPGELASQAGRAVLGAYHESMLHWRPNASIGMKSQWREYDGHAQSALRVNNVDDMDVLVSEILNARLPHFIIKELETMNPMIVAVGPAPSAKIEQVTSLLETLE